KLKFNFVDLKNIEAVGNSLHFGEQSIVLDQNNLNVVANPHRVSGYLFDGLGPDWLCHIIDPDKVDSYTLNTTLFYGNEDTRYTWYKLNDPAYDSKTPISRASSIDIRTFGGYGTYKVEVEYHNSGVEVCKVFDDILIVKNEISAPVSGGSTCIKPSGSNTLTDVIVYGENLKWYVSETSKDILPLTHQIKEGDVYYVSQGINGSDECEGPRLKVVIRLVECAPKALINPSIRLRVSK
ncbi:MAG: hypothetical protein ACRCVU_14940, partial [Flavobacterium sp.]